MDSNHLLIVTILIIFGTTVLGTILQRRARDPCLKKFRGNFVFVQLKSGRWIWGRLEVYSKSLEIIYEKPSLDPAGHHELSYLLFEDKLPEIQVVLRPLPLSGTAAARLWDMELRQIISPSLWSEARRSCRNVFNTLRDAFSQSVGVLLGAFRARNPAAMMIPAEQKLVSTGQMLVTYGNNAYEPILEKYLGKPVVTEMLVAEKWIEHVGLLEEYSDKYILLRDVQVPADFKLPEEMGSNRHVDVAFPRTHSVVRHLASRDKKIS